MPDVPKIVLPDLSSAADVVRHHARVRPEAVALVFQDEPITYAELDVLSSRCANALIAAGVQPGDRV
ncbi:MAG: AMP-binding protein, partial [Phenylobacterium sp.]|nr:AMP-binding protein [Phenylobacterium sp.]